MARMTRSEAETSATKGFSTTHLLEELVTGTNPDGTPFVLPVRIEDGVTAEAPGIAKSSAGFMAIGQTAKQFTGLVETSTSLTSTIVLEKVTAGKTLYITDIYVGTDSASGEASKVIDVVLQNQKTTMFRGPCHTLVPIDAVGLETQPFAQAGEEVTLLLPKTEAGKVRVWYNIFGFEQ